MPLSTHALRRHSPHARPVLALALLALVLLAAPSRDAFATRYVVDAGGGGDFTTIQAAIDAQAAEFRDSVLVLPGGYAETLALPAVSGAPAWIVATGGAPVTSVISLTAPNDDAASSWRSYRLEGLTFAERPVLYHQAPTRVRFERCVFLKGLYSDPRYSECPPIVKDCDFHGPTTLLDCYQTWTSLRFAGAPLTITHASGAGSFVLQDCTFEGPADTLVYMPWANNDWGAFDRCTFASAHHGLVYGEDCAQVQFPVTACVFRDLGGFAIATFDTSAGGTVRRAKLSVRDSRFERCGTAVYWVHGWGMDGGWEHGAELVRDTVLASTGDGIVLGPQYGGGIFDSVVDGSGGNGITCLQTRPPATTQFLNPARAVYSNLRVTGNRLDGLCIRDSIPCAWPYYAYAPPSGFLGPRVEGSTFAGNGGAGLKVVAGRWDVHGCMAYANGTHGFDLTNTSPAFAPLTRANTSVLNGGDGFRLVTYGGLRDSAHLVERNLAAMNAGVGLRAPGAGVGSLARNDAWGNYLAPYVGAWASLDSNLVVDPRFCDLSAGVSGLGLQQGSPSGPSGVYGLIGARGEECPNTVAVEPGAPGALAFAVRPSVARGSVEFVAPAGAGEGRVELYDLAGRLVWRAALGPATGTVRWHGESERGHAAAGLYWVRFTRGDEHATRRLVWLE